MRMGALAVVFAVLGLAGCQTLRDWSYRFTDLIKRQR